LFWGVWMTVVLDRLAKEAGAKKPRRVGQKKRKARQILVARRVLEIYAAGGTIKDIVKEFGKQPRHPYTKKKMTTDKLLEWALDAILSDEAKEIGRARVMGELGAVAFADPEAYAKWDADGVTLVPSKNLTQEQRAAIAEVTDTKTEHGRNVKVKMHPKMEALRLLGQATGLLVDRKELTGKGGKPLQFEDVSAREALARQLEGMAARVSGE